MNDHYQAQVGLLMTTESLSQILNVVTWMAGAVGGAIQFAREIDAFGLKNSELARKILFVCIGVLILALLVNFLVL